MLKELRCLRLKNLSTSGQSQIYEFDYLSGRVFVISHEDSCKLISHPELVGLDVQKSLYHATADFLLYLQNNGFLNKINIVNILRGGLNFPLENACVSLDSSIPDVSFVSSERMSSGKVSYLQMKYKKVIPSLGSSVLVGDIIASGSTLINTIDYLADCYEKSGLYPKNIVVFTIGTYKALDVVRKIDKELHNRWSFFEGIIPVFYEAIFNVYDNCGITGLNTFGLDFYMADALVLPQLRLSYQCQKSTIFEKCAIYDGGDRRFNPEAHMKLICDYWTKLMSGGSYSIEIFLREKLGYDATISFEDWVTFTGYKDYDFGIDMKNLYHKEMKMIETILDEDFTVFCATRLECLKKYFKGKTGYHHE